MPFPHTHIAFFVLVFGAIAVFIGIRSIRRSVDVKHVLFILLVGGFCALLPDVPFVFNLFNHSDVHTSIGFLPTHSLLFSFSGFAVGVLLGYVAYREQKKMLGLGVIGLAASLSHLLLDDLMRGSVNYLYPFASEPVSLFAYTDYRYLSVDRIAFEVAWLLGILYFFVIFLLTFYGLTWLGFKFEYRGE